MKGLRTTIGTPQRGNGSRTPALNTPDETDDYMTFTGVSKELHDRLAALAGDKESFRRDSYTQSVELISSDPRKTAVQDREQALLDILSEVSNKYVPEKISSGLIETLIKRFFGHGSDIEAYASLQTIAVAIASVDEDHPDYSQAHELVDDFTVKVLKYAQDTTLSAQLRAHVATGYAVLSFFRHYGAGGYGVDDLVENLISLAEQSSNEENTLIVASLMGVGLAITLASDVDYLIEELLPTLVPFIRSRDHDVAVTAAKIAGLFFERHRRGHIDTKSMVVEALEEAYNESAKRFAKRDKKERKSVIRDVLATLDSKPPSTLVHFLLSRNKYLQIGSWRTLIVIQHLKWVFGSGLQTQVANNPFASTIVEDEESRDEYDGVQSHSQVQEELDLRDADNGGSVDGRRDENRRQARLGKLEAQGRLGNAIG